MSGASGRTEIQEDNLIFIISVSSAKNCDNLFVPKKASERAGESGMPLGLGHPELNWVALVGFSVPSSNGSAKVAVANVNFAGGSQGSRALCAQVPERLPPRIEFWVVGG